MFDHLSRSFAGSCILAFSLAACAGDTTTDPGGGEPTIGPPAALAFVTEPADAVAGQAIDPAIRVEIRDAAGARVSNAELPVTIALGANPGGAGIQGTTTVTAVSGVAIFSGLSLDRAAAGYTLSATATGLAPATSAAFSISPAAPARLVLLTQPGPAEGQEPFDPAIEVAVHDAFGNVVPDVFANVTVSLAASPSQDTLGGTRTAAAVDGVAVFDDLSVALPGEGYVLEASSGALEPALSDPFDVRLTFAQVSADGVYTCGVTEGGFAYCWGRNVTGPFGNGTEDPSATPTPVSGRLRFATVTAEGRTCGVARDDVAYCWGDNFQGRLGDGTTIDRLTPTPVAGGLSFVQVSAGDSHACGITTANAAFCWGRNSDGQLGDGTTQFRTVPTAVAGGHAFVQVSAGRDHTCAITADGAAYCWGRNDRGPLGDGTEEPRLTPAAVVGGLNFSRISAGFSHTCGVTTAGAAFCWGSNQNARLGDGTTGGERLTPTPVAGGLSFTHVSAATNHTCAAATDGTAYCWGSNFFGQLGDGTGVDRTAPTPVAGGLRFAQVDAGSSHTCAVTTDRIAYCWGDNGFNQLGDGTAEARLAPARVVQ